MARCAITVKKVRLTALMPPKSSVTRLRRHGVGCRTRFAGSGHVVRDKTTVVFDGSGRSGAGGFSAVGGDTRGSYNRLKPPAPPRSAPQKNGDSAGARKNPAGGRSGGAPEGPGGEVRRAPGAEPARPPG